MSMFSLSSRTEPFRNYARILLLMLLTKNRSKPEPARRQWVNWYWLLVPTASVFFNAWHSMKSRSLLCLTFVPDTPTNNTSSQFQMDFQHGSPSLCFSSSRACLCKSNTLNACDVNKFFCFLTCCQRKDELSLASIFFTKAFSDGFFVSYIMWTESS